MEEASIPDTPEGIHRNLIFNLSASEIPSVLDELMEEMVPDHQEGFSFLLNNGLNMFSVSDTEELNYENFQKHYYRAMHKVVVLYHKFADEDMLTESEEHTKYLINFNKLFEIFYYWEQAIRSLWRVKKASHPLYDSSLNTDIGLFRFKPIDPEINNCYQNLILYLLSCLAERGWRRQMDQCMERIYTEDGYDTHAWRPVINIKDFVYMMTGKDANYTQWFNLTSNPSNSKNSITYLMEVHDLHFIDVKKDRKLFSFPNGIYESSVWDEATESWTDRWYPHAAKSDENEYTSHDICPQRSSCKFFEEEFELFKGDDWYDIETPQFQKILDYQQFPEDVCRWMYILLCGRLLYSVGDLDEWQVMPFLKGKAKSGKSTILTKVCKQFFHALDVGVLSNNCERKFGLSALKDKFLFIAPEIKGNIGLEQCDFQTIISGEDTSVPEKFKTAAAVKWEVPGAMAGNEPPEYSDNQGSISRRLIVFNFGNKVKRGDTQLGKKLEKEIPLLIMKGNRAYIEAVNKYGKKDIWNVLPQYFKDTQQDMTEQTNSLVHFLGSDKVHYGKNFHCRQKVFVQYYNEHVRENGLTKHTWKKDFYEGPLEDKGIEILVRHSRHDPVAGRKYACNWFKGIGIVADDEQAAREAANNDELE